MIKSLNLFYCLTIIIYLALNSCSGKTGEDSSGNNGTKKLKIAVIPKGSTHNHWRSVHAGAEKAAQELGNVEIIWQGPQKEDDREMQIQVVQNFISRGVDGIVLAPLDDRSLAPPVTAAVKRNIPVVIIDSDLKSDAYASYVATNNFAGGKLCAKRLVEVLGGKGKIIMLKYSEGSAATIEREAGFMEGIKEYGPEIEILSSNLYAGATMEKAFQASQNLLNRFGSQVNGIFCSNESATQGMLRALQLAGKAGQVKFVGFDVNQTLLEGLKKGEIHGFAVQDPIKIGYEGVKTAVAVIEGKPYKKSIDTGVKMVTLDNLEEPDVVRLLNPQPDKYLNQ